MTDFDTIYNDYLIKLELHKKYSLGSIYNRLVANNVKVDISFLFLNMMCSKKFKSDFSQSEGLHEKILMERIS